MNEEMRNTVWILPVVLLLGACGCMEKQDLAPGEFDRAWNLTDVSAAQASAEAPAREAPRLPRRWVVRRTEDTPAAAASMTAAMEKLQAGGAESIELSVSPQQAEQLAAILGEVRQTLERLERIVRRVDGIGRQEWADLLAEVLVHVETARRLAAGEGGRDAAGSALPVEPMMKMLGAWLQRHGSAGALGDLSPREVRRLGDILAGMVIRAGFDVAGKQVPCETNAQAAEMLRKAARPRDARAPLAALLADRLASAPPSMCKSDMRETVLGILSAAPRALQVVQSFLVQWKKIDVLEIDIREDVRVVTLAVRPGRQVRMEGLVSALPALALRGRTKIVILDDQINPAGETVISFQSEGGGGVYMLFDSIEHALARLAVPLENGRIREVRAFRDSSAEGPRMLNVKLLMESEASGGDRRRMIVVQDTETTRLVRTALAVRTLSEGGRTAVSYLLPQRRYSYEHIKQPKVE